MSNASSDLPFLFILYMVTESQEIVCVNENGTIILPCYEFEARYGNEAITTALARQMEQCMGYRTPSHAISLADTTEHYEHESEKGLFTNIDNDDDEYEVNPTMIAEKMTTMNDCPFRVCVAYNCVPCEKHSEDPTLSPFVLWTRETMEYRVFEEWDAERKARAAQEKKITRIPVMRWNDMIMSGEIDHVISAMATKIAQTWIATAKPPSFPRKNQKMMEN